MSISPVLTAASSTQYKLIASDGNPGDNFGWAAAIDGNTLVVGAQGASGGGAVYVYVFNGSAWTQQAKLTFDDSPIPWPWFGSSIAINGDTIVVGAPLASNVFADAGAAYVFVRSGTTWTQQAKLIASNPQYGDRFGDAVAISGNTVVIGCGWKDSAYVFVRNGTSWTQQAELTASGAIAYFGNAVAIDGNTIIVGDSSPDVPGAAWVFVRSGTTWAQQQKLTASDGTSVINRFGSSVAIVGDTIIIGSWNSNDFKGAAYVFVRTGNSWTQEARLTASDGSLYDRFGISVAMYGNTVVVGAYLADVQGEDSGSAFIFTRNGTSWTECQKLSPGDGALEDNFGRSVGIYSDFVVVGSPAGSAVPNRLGSAYVFFIGAPTPVGDNVSVTPVDPNPVIPGKQTPVTVTFTQVTSPGETTVTSSGAGTPPPNGFKLGDPPVYYSIETTAGYSGPIHICIDYSNMSFGSEKDLKLFHWSSTTNSWQDVTDPGYPDLVHHIICGTITSFSLFGIFEPSYSFTGFLPPVENPPVMNTAKAGQTIPVKWQLPDGKGGYISDLGAVISITYQQVQCSNLSDALTSEVTATASGSSGLHYDATMNQFVYNWNTNKSMAGNCYVLTLKLNDGRQYQADFSLK